MQANQANQAGQASVFLRDWGRVEPAVLVLLDRDPAFYIVKCRDITQEVRDVLEAVRAGDPSRFRRTSPSSLSFAKKRDCRDCSGQENVMVFVVKPCL